jgi:hypothetical protein
VEARCQCVRVFAAGGTDDEVLEAAFGPVALSLEAVGELSCLLAGLTLDANLPRREPAVELFLLPRPARRLVVPAVLLVEPVLDPARPRLDAVLAELRLDDFQRLLRLGASVGVDEDCFAVAGDGETPLSQLPGEPRSPARRSSKPVACSSSSTSIRMRQSSSAMSIRA